MTDREERARYNNQLISLKEKFRYSYLDLCFSYSKSKETKMLSPINVQTKQTQDNHDHPKFRMSCRLSRKHQSFQGTSSMSFFKTNKVKSARHESTEQVTQSEQMPYIGWAFPQRKKKSGEQQFLKLLMKYSDNLLLSNQLRQKQSNQGLFEQNPQKQRSLKPKLKMRTRVNWIKDRYCVNRDKQGGLFEYVVPQTSPKQPNIPSLPNSNTSLAKKQRRQRKRSRVQSIKGSHFLKQPTTDRRPNNIK